MRALIISSGIYASAALLLVYAAGLFAPALLDIGDSPVQTTLVLAFYAFCAFVLTGKQPNPVFKMAGIPILTQFIHLFQKYDFPAGAASIWRLLPFVMLGGFLCLQKVNSQSLDQGTRAGLVSWVVVHLWLFVITPYPAQVIVAGCIFYILLLPLAFLFLRHTAENQQFMGWSEDALCLLFFILALGTIGLVIAGSQYKDSTNLLVTRNIADTNVTMAYFILLWPFLLLYCKRKGNWILRVSGLILFLVIVVLSFSRGSVLLVVPYLLITLLLDGSLRDAGAILLLIGTLVLYYPAMHGNDFFVELAYAWRLRLEDFMYGMHAAGKLQEVSGRSEIHAAAYQIFRDSPFTGHGISSFEVLGPGYREAHSLFYTLLAEQGVAGAAYFYLLIYLVWRELGHNMMHSAVHRLLFTSFLFYLIFNHTVGSVFVILPRKSLTINCIAPILILLQYFYARSSHTLNKAVE